MPRFYFDVRDGERLTRDDEGSEFRGIEAARDEATRALADIGRDVLPGTERGGLTIEVRDEAKVPVLEARLTFEIQRLR